MSRFDRAGRLLSGVALGTGTGLLTYGGLEALFTWPVINEVVGVGSWLGMIYYVAKDKDDD